MKHILTLLLALLVFNVHAAGVEDYSTTAGDNTTINGISIAEGMTPGNVNNAMRQQMADTRKFYEGAGFINQGHTPTQTGSTTFTVVDDHTGDYTVDRRLKLVDATTFYARTITSTFSSPDTTITVATDDGDNLSGSLTEVWLGLLDPTNYPIDVNSISRTGTMVTQNANAVAITGGVIDGTTIGVTTASTGSFTTVRIGTSLRVAETVTVTSVLDEDAMGTDSATALATQQSIKAYVDAISIGVGAFASVSTTGVITASTQVPFDNTIPQNDEGTYVMQTPITPENASSELIIDYTLSGGNSGTTQHAVAAFQNGVTDALHGCVQWQHMETGRMITITVRCKIPAASTSSRTYIIRAGPDGAHNWYLGGNASGNPIMGGTYEQTLTVTEMLP